MLNKWNRIVCGYNFVLFLFVCFHFFSLISTMPLRSIQAIAGVKSLFLFIADFVFYCMTISQFIYSLRWKTLGLFPDFSCYE